MKVKRHVLLITIVCSSLVFIDSGIKALESKNSDEAMHTDFHKEKNNNHYDSISSKTILELQKLLN